jgi:hypothetical protein
MSKNERFESFLLIVLTSNLSLGACFFVWDENHRL